MRTGTAINEAVRCIQAYPRPVGEHRIHFTVTRSVGSDSHLYALNYSDPGGEGNA